MHSKTIVLTGASSGIGFATAQRLLAEGHHVVAGMRDLDGRNAEAAAALRSAAEGAAGTLTILELDLADDVARVRFVEAVHELSGTVDVLINNAGVMYSGITEAFSPAQLRRQFETNTVAPFHLSQLVLPRMRARRSGLLLHVSSLAGGLNFPFFSMYSGTKAALESIAEGFKDELAPFGIDSVVVEPGPFVTRLIGSNSEPERADVVDGYGAVARLCREMEAANRMNLAPDNPVAQRPEMVADVIARLVAMEPGSRPFRTIAGNIDFGLAPLNEAKESVQRAMLDAWNLRTALRFQGQ